ncbi:MAG: hypothetical protein HQ566_00215 [Candidatus Omnitrophica bacterium]|nr:hypothetical protein [Candidatus Omnitrophota bacterium]
MVILVKIVGIVILLEGIILLLNPKVMKNLIGFWAKGKRLYAAGALNLLFAVVFFSVASSCKMPVVLTILGVIALTKAIYILAFGSKARAGLDWWAARPAGAVRILSIIVIAIGLLLLRSI